MPEATRESKPARASTAISETLSRQIQELIPGGVNSPFRSFQEVGGHTIFFSRGRGAYLFDVDGNSYIDYLGAWGPAILGHCPPPVVAACQQALSQGPVFGAPHALELELSAQLIELVPSLERIRFVNSGTEAVMSAVRLARGYTGKDLLVMFEGCYHGHADAVLASRTCRSSEGIPSAVAANTVLVPFNNLDALEATLEAHKRQVAAVLIEPVAGSMGVIPPEPGYLSGVHKLCSDHQALLIFDEVLTGLRVAFGGAQALYRLTPDLSCFGKALGGGMPIGAYGGRQEIMDCLLPGGNVYQAGTFSGNPVTMAGGIETLKLLGQAGVYESLEARAAQLFEELGAVVRRRSLPVQLQRVGSLFAVLFAGKPVRNYQESQSIDAQTYARFFHYLLDRGVYMPPSAVDAACISAAHSQADISKTAQICTDALTSIF